MFIYCSLPAIFITSIVHNRWSSFHKIHPLLALKRGLNDGTTAYHLKRDTLINHEVFCSILYVSLSIYFHLSFLPFSIFYNFFLFFWFPWKYKKSFFAAKFKLFIINLCSSHLVGRSFKDIITWYSTLNFLKLSTSK